MRLQLSAYLDSINSDLEAVYGDEPKIVFGQPGMGMWLQCEAITPKSAEGRKVDVYIPNNLIAGLMKACKVQMIKDRSKPEGGTVR